MKISLKSSNLPNLKVLFTNADQLTTSKKDELLNMVLREKPMIVAISVKSSQKMAENVRSVILKYRDLRFTL